MGWKAQEGTSHQHKGLRVYRSELIVVRIFLNKKAQAAMETSAAALSFSVRKLLFSAPEQLPVDRPPDYSRLSDSFQQYIIT